MGFSLGFNSSRGAHLDRWGSSYSDSGSDSGSTSRSSCRYGRDSRRDRSPSMSPLRGLDTRFSDLMRDCEATRAACREVNGGRSMFESMPSMFGGAPSMLGSDFSSSAYSGFSGMPRGRQRSRSSSFDSDRDTVRPGSAYSGFPGIPGMASSAFQSDRSGPFNMRRTDSHSSFSGSRRHRSPSPPVTAYSRGYRTTERAPQSTFASGSYSTESPQGYTSRSYGTRASSPPRRQRTPSPPPRRQRSPSPVGRTYCRGRDHSPPPAASRHGVSSRSDSARGYRTSERRPEGASSRTDGSSSRERSHSRAEEPSRNQYGGGYSSSYGSSESTSNNAYNARPMPSRSQSSARAQKHQEQRARSPPPQPRGHARDTSRIRSASTATATPAHSRAELKAIFNTYNTTWEPLSRHDKNYPLPASTRDLYRLGFAGGSSSNSGNWSAEQILVANVQLIFLAGFGLSGSLKRGGDSLSVKIENSGRQAGEVQALAKWLSRKEQPRWHPDRMNARTGKVGVLDEGISKKRDVVAMRTAVQELLGVVGK
ncbi:hypothetical protein Q7P35_006625 [Cladosporium inversicolor]